MPSEIVLLVAGAFLGAFVSGTSGFAFAVVASAVWLHALPPLRAVPLIVASSMVLNLVFTLHMRRKISLRQLAPMLAGCIAGVPLGVLVLQHANAAALRTGAALLLIAYSVFALVSEKLPTVCLAGGRAATADAAVGFFGGFIGGATSLMGVLTVVWARFRGWSKMEQRAVVQPFVLFGHALALAFLGGVGGLGIGTAIDFFWSLPALVAGGWLGLKAFHWISEGGFNRIVLWLLLGSGLSLILKP